MPIPFCLGTYDLRALEDWRTGGIMSVIIASLKP